MPPPSKRATRVREVKPASNEFDYPSDTEFNEPPESFDSYVRCIFGQKGYGKSTLASQFPNALTLMYEPNRRNLRIRQLAIKKQQAKDIIDGAPDPWEQLKNTTQRFIDDESINHLNFDSVDIAYDTAYHSICAANKITHPKEAGRGSADVWIEIREEWSAYFDTLVASRLGVNLISHAKTREIEELNGGKVDITGPSCAPACLTYIKQACDYVLYYGIHGGKRAICLRDPTNQVFVAAGVEGKFLQPNGKPINVLEMPVLGDKKTGYQVLCEAFNNKHWDIDTPEDERKVSESKPKGPPARRTPR